MAEAEHSIYSTRTRTLLIIIGSMLFIGVWVAVYSFSKGSKGSKTISPTSGIPTNINVTPGSKSSEKYVELQRAANLKGTKQADAQGNTFIPTIIGNKADDSSQSFNNKLADILKEKASGPQDYERLSKQLAMLLAEFNKQGNNIDNLLRLIRELQNQGYNVEDLEALLSKLRGNGYNTDELARLLALLKNQGYAINDLESLLRKLLAQGYDPDLINKLLEKLLKDRLKASEDALKDRLKALEDALKKLQAGGYNTTNNTYVQQVNNPDFNKLLDQLANKGYNTKSLEDLLKELMNKGYNIFDMQILMQQLQKDGYDISQLQDLLDQFRKAGQDIKDLRSLLDALSKKNISTPIIQKEPTESKGSTKPEEPTDIKSALSNIFNKKDNNSAPISAPEQQYQDLVKKQQENVLMAEKNKKLVEEKQVAYQKSLISSESRKKDMESILANMSATADTLAANSTKIATQSFIQGDEIKSDNESTFSGTEKSNLASAGLNNKNDTILKAGTVLFAVLETAVNSDEPGPILARIVQPPLQNTTIIGSMQTSSNKYAEGLLLSFSTANIPDRIRTYGITAVAIDPDTARTAIASDVDHHYLLRWGTLFAASFLQGYSKAVAQSGTKVDTSNNGAQSVTTTTQSPLNPTQQVHQGLSEVATAWGQGISTFSSRPTTITIKAGTSIGLLLTADFTIPSSDEIPEAKELSSQQNKSNNNQAKTIAAVSTSQNQQNILPSTNDTTITSSNDAIMVNQNTIKNNTATSHNPDANHN